MVVSLLVQDNNNSNPNPNQLYIDTKVPALQAMHVEDNVAPVTAEYVPVQASDEEYG